MGSGPAKTHVCICFDGVDFASRFGERTGDKAFSTFLCSFFPLSVEMLPIVHV